MTCVNPTDGVNLIEKARAVRIEDELARRGFDFWLKPRHNNLGQPCPMCGGHDRFSVNTKKQVFNCRGCGAKGDVIALVQSIDGLSFKEAIRLLTGHVARRKRATGANDGHDRHTNSPEPAKAASEAGSIARARRLWAEAIPIDGTLAGLYLRVTRGLTLNEDLSHCVRFHAQTWWREGDDENSPLLRVPCLLAAYRQIDGDEIVAIQKTRLSPDGSKVARKMRGPVKGAAIKIDRDEDATYGVAVGEGLETCLAARELGFRPCWALGSAGQIGTFPVLAGVDALTILAETGDASARAVKTCGARWRGAGRDVIVTQSQFGSDINDAIREATR